MEAFIKRRRRIQEKWDHAIRHLLIWWERSSRLISRLDKASVMRTRKPMTKMSHKWRSIKIHSTHSVQSHSLLCLKEWWLKTHWREKKPRLDCLNKPRAVCRSKTQRMMWMIARLLLRWVILQVWLLCHQDWFVLWARSNLFQISIEEWRVMLQACYWRQMKLWKWQSVMIISNWAEIALSWSQTPHLFKGNDSLIEMCHKQ